ncbi:MAG: esterase/lipase family protein, partial [Acidimicrobiales bacterium]
MPASAAVSVLPSPASSVRPSWLLTVLESRAPFELMGSLALGGVLGMDNRGDGHTVLVLPGFGANDSFSIPLRAHLKARGFEAIGWGEGFNTGWSVEILERLVLKVRSLHASSSQKVSLVGWSLGGLYARSLAHRMPEEVRSLITLGSPFAGDPRASVVWPIYERVNAATIDQVDKQLLELIRTSPPVPTTAIISRSDGVVDWHGTAEVKGPQSETIEVLGSHVGLIANPAVLFAVSERLAQPEGAWQPFVRSGGLRR